MTFFRAIQPDQSGWGWPACGSTQVEIRQIASSLDQAAEIVRRSVAGLDEAMVWHRPAPGINAIANLLLHITGTEHEWIHHKVGGQARLRDRDGEFAASAGTQSWPTILAAWEDGRLRSAQIITAIRDADLRRNDIGGNLSISFALHYTAQHVAYHAGEIVLIRRLMEAEFGPYGRPD
jgi:uncharacterized damage-inducible protein DinB